MQALLWRLVAFDTHSGRLGLSEIELRDASGAAMPCTITASHLPDEGDVAALSDAATTQPCLWQDSAVSASSFAISFELSTAQEVKDVRLAAAGNVRDFPVRVSLQFFASGQWVTQSDFNNLYAAAPWSFESRQVDPVPWGDVKLQIFTGARIGAQDESDYAATPSGFDSARQGYVEGALTRSAYRASGTPIVFDHSSALALTSDFCLEFRLSVVTRPASGSVPLIIKSASTGHRLFCVDLRPDGAVEGNMSNGAGSEVVGRVKSAPLSAGWHRVEYTRSGDVVSLFVDGVLAGSVGFTGNNYVNAAHPLAVGGATGGGSAGRYEVLIEMVRVASVGRDVSAYAEGLDRLLPDAFGRVYPALLSSFRGFFARGQLGLAGWVAEGAAQHAVSAKKAADVECGGQGRIYGTVELYAQAGNIPLPRRVRLHRSRDGLLVRETWSDENGHYRFDGLSTRYEYDVIAWDHEGQFRSTIANNLRPEVLP